MDEYDEDGKLSKRRIYRADGKIEVYSSFDGSGRQTVGVLYANEVALTADTVERYLSVSYGESTAEVVEREGSAT